MVDLFYSIASLSVLVISAYAFCVGEYISAFYTALFYICLTIGSKENDNGVY